MTDVAFLGLGIMGSRQAARLAGAGHRLTVWNRTRLRAEAFAAQYPARIAETPADAAARAEIVFTMLPGVLAVEQVLLDPGGAADGARPGTVFVDCTTIAPPHARTFATALGALGHPFVDAPVIGSAERAANGTLTIHAGGEPEAIARAVPLLGLMGTVVCAGAPGQGQVATMMGRAVADAVGDPSAAALAARHGPDAVLRLERSLSDVRACPARRRAGRLIAGAGHDPFAAHPEDDFAAVLDFLEGTPAGPR